MTTTASRPERILVDYDVTLFRTDEWASDLWTNIANRTERPYDAVEADGNHFHADPVLGGYDFDAHIDAYGLDSQAMWGMLDEMAKSKDYLYPESATFIQELRGAGYDPSILSFGETRFQTAKIVPFLGKLAGNTGSQESGPVPNLQFDVIFEKKGPYIGRNYAGERGTLVDDVPNQNLPEGFVELHIDRRSGLLSPQEKAGGFVVADLLQAYDVIRKIYG